MKKIYKANNIACSSCANLIKVSLEDTFGEIKVNLETNPKEVTDSFENNFVGTFGDVATLWFYPAHHITTGEGGAVLTNNTKLKKIIESLRDWGSKLSWRYKR